MQNSKDQDGVGEFYLPEWETTARHREEEHKGAAHEQTFKDKARAQFNHFIPAHRKYCGVSRKIACIILLVVSLAVLVLIIGLAAGLSHKSR